MIKVIAFDLDDTLWNNRPVLINAEKRLNEWLVVEVPRLKFSVVEMRSLRNEILAIEPDLANRITELRRRIIEQAISLSGYEPVAASDLSHKAMEVFIIARNDIEFFDGALEAIQKLKNSFLLGALTNGNADIRLLGLDDHFSFAFSAEEVGAPKPAHDLFHKALSHTDTQPHQMVYVGDDPVLDIDSANEAGLHTVWVKNPDKDKVGETLADERIDQVRHLPEAIDRLLNKIQSQSQS
jgi:FMN hydrolase / 5-amino-6-(5-phospho-D-ribitylamino)uracil phosphatase